MNKRHHFVARKSVEAAAPSPFTFREWHLLVYESFSQGELGQDIRDIVEAYPSSVEISVLSPYSGELFLLNLIGDSTASMRASGTDIFLSVLTFDEPAGVIRCTPLDRGSLRNSELPREVQNAWLFDLFHRHHGLVRAPDGIHFGKTSGKHSLYFLRAANCLVGSIEATTLGFFALPLVYKAAPSKIYVDTGPLISMAQSLSRQCVARKLWPREPSIESFGSYDGLLNLKGAAPDHLILVSASTSGNLASDIVLITGQPSRVCTVFYLQATKHSVGASRIVADLGESTASLYGYPEIETYHSPMVCKWCSAGVPFVEFEGDQFLLQKRRIEKINIAYHPAGGRKHSLKASAQEMFATALGRNVFSVQLTAAAAHGYRDVLIDGTVYKSTTGFGQVLQDGLKKGGSPGTLDLVVTDLCSALEIATFEPFRASTAPFAQTTASSAVQQIVPISKGTGLVILGLIDSLHTPRKTSEILRSVLPDGKIWYAAALTLVESPEEFRQLCSALRTGAEGPNTFSFEPGHVLYLRKRTSQRSSWEKERGWLEGLIEDDAMAGRTTPIEITQRLAFFDSSGAATTGIFWKGQNQVDLQLQRDFVYLPVSGKESQADVYAIVSNLISTAIQLNRDVSEVPTSDEWRLVLRQSVYSEALVDPNNFMKFNDAILRAALLRAAEPHELNYSRDLDLSGAITSLIVHEISEWQFGRGQILPEFLVALATKHLRLCQQHCADIREAVIVSGWLPPYIRRMI